MRKAIKDRYYRVFMYQPVDRVPDVEFGYWPQTIRRWLKEGLPLDLSQEERNEMFSARLDAFFGFEGEGAGIDLWLGMNPTLKAQGRDAGGVRHFGPWACCSRRSIAAAMRPAASLIRSM
jgi:hypothetical protein